MTTSTTDLVKAGTVKSKFIINVNGFYIYKSVTAYDRLNDVIDYVIAHENGNEFDRFANLESAIISFNSILEHYNK